MTLTSKILFLKFTLKLHNTLLYHLGYQHGLKTEDLI